MKKIAIFWIKLVVIFAATQLVAWATYELIAFK
jgi:hypothetical protein